MPIKAQRTVKCSVCQNDTFERDYNGESREMTETPYNQIRERVERLHLTSCMEESLTRITKTLYEEMRDKGIAQTISISNRISTALFLACDGHACIAIPKVKIVCGSGSYLGHINKARNSLKIPHGTAHKKFDSLCKAAGINSKEIDERGHRYIDLLNQRAAYFPTSVATVSLYAANLVNWKPQRIALKSLCALTGCGQISINSLLKVLEKEVKRMAILESDRPLEDKDGTELVRIINKETREGLTLEEQGRKADLIALFKSRN